VVEYLAIELVTQDDHVLTIPRQKLLIGVFRIPDPGFAHEVEPRAMDNGGTFPLGVGAEKDGCPKDALKGCNESPILRTALLHAEGVQHLCSAAEGNPCCVLTNRKCRQKDRHEPVLTPWQSVTRVSSDLQNELAIAPFVQ
jgi:hypothetical protein